MGWVKPLMIMKTSRTLPDFENPPLSEVVVGIQFEPPPQYNSVYAGQVWDIFKTDFPKVVEQPGLMPQFELFSGGMQGSQMQFGFGGSFMNNRLWFVSQDDSHLLQFQNDRLLLNWRKNPVGAPYPRFAVLSNSFGGYVEKLQASFSKIFNFDLRINQAEISYVNIISVEEMSESGKWLKVGNDSKLKIESFNTTFTEVLMDEFSRPCGRFYSVCQSDQLGKNIHFSLTCRGKPNGEDIDAGKNFLNFGHEYIVNKFTELTTKEAHSIWGRNQ